VPDCLVCREISGEIPIPGGFIVNDSLVAAFHMPPLPGNPRPYLGHLLVVSRRHAPRFGDLTDDESAAVGRTAARLARALTDLGGAEWVHSAVIGLHVPHFHLHLLPRYPGTPGEVRWYAIDEWEGGRHGGPAEIADFVGRLRG
jgi:histidine triad (HIT) family protein